MLDRFKIDPKYLSWIDAAPEHDFAMLDPLQSAFFGEGPEAYRAWLISCLDDTGQTELRDEIGRLCEKDARGRGTDREALKNAARLHRIVTEGVDFDEAVEAMHEHRAEEPANWEVVQSEMQMRENRPEGFQLALWQRLLAVMDAKEGWRNYEEKAPPRWKRGPRDIFEQAWWAAEDYRTECYQRDNTDVGKLQKYTVGSLAAAIDQVRQLIMAGPRMAAMLNRDQADNARFLAGLRIMHMPEDGTTWLGETGWRVQDAKDIHFAVKAAADLRCDLIQGNFAVKPEHHEALLQQVFDGAVRRDFDERNAAGLYLAQRSMALLNLTMRPRDRMYLFNAHMAGIEIDPTEWPDDAQLQGFIRHAERENDEEHDWYEFDQFRPG